MICVVHALFILLFYCDLLLFFFFFFFNDTATTEIYTLSLHDALPICLLPAISASGSNVLSALQENSRGIGGRDRKSTRLNSSHSQISYAVFCLKKKKKRNNHITMTYKQQKSRRHLAVNDHSVSRRSCA